MKNILYMAPIQAFYAQLLKSSICCLSNNTRQLSKNNRQARISFSFFFQQLLHNLSRIAQIDTKEVLLKLLNSIQTAWTDIYKCFSDNETGLFFLNAGDMQKKSAYSLQNPGKIEVFLLWAIICLASFLGVSMSYFLCLICSIFKAFENLFPLQISPLIILTSSVFHERSLCP